MRSDTPTAVVLSDADVDQLRSVLITDDGHENFAVIFCGPARTAGGLLLLGRDVVGAPPGAYRERLEHHLEIRPAFLNEVVTRAKESALSPIIAHSHPFASAAQYSPSDNFGERRLLPVLNQLLPDLYPASLLMTPKAFTARRLEQEEFQKVPVAVRGIRARDYLNDHDHVRPFGELASVDRQVRAFGIEGQMLLRSLRVAIVGLGGTGSVIAEELCRLGVQDIVLVDPDYFEISNLSRLWGSEAKDIERRITKTQVIDRHLTRINPSINLTRIEDSVIKQVVLLRLTDRDVIFCCTDNHLSRAVLNRFSHQYLIPSVDMGVRIDARFQRVAGAAGRVSLVGPGLTCLRCSHHIDSDAVRAESLPSDERQRLSREGYVQGDQGPAPAVISLNTTVASLAITTTLQMFVNLTGGDPALDQIYDARTGSLFRVLPRHEPGCDVCSPEAGVKGLGDKQIVSAY